MTTEDDEPVQATMKTKTKLKAEGKYLTEGNKKVDGRLVKSQGWDTRLERRKNKILMILTKLWFYSIYRLYKQQLIKEETMRRTNWEENIHGDFGIAKFNGIYFSQAEYTFSQSLPQSCEFHPSSFNYSMPLDQPPPSIHKLCQGKIHGWATTKPNQHQVFPTKQTKFPETSERVHQPDIIALALACDHSYEMLTNLLTSYSTDLPYYIYIPR